MARPPSSGGRRRVRAGGVRLLIAGILVGGLGNARDTRTYLGAAPSTRPAAQGFWAASTVGTGPRTITWPVQSGSWSLVAMNADATSGLDLRADIGATLPWLLPVATGLLVAGAVLLVAGALLIALPAVRASPTPTRQEVLS